MNLFDRGLATAVAAIVCSTLRHPELLVNIDSLETVALIRLFFLIRY